MNSHPDIPAKSLYLDNAATSHPKPDSVYAGTMKYLREIGASSGRSGYRLALEADRKIFEVREQIALFLGVQDSSRIVFTHNATHGLNMALKGILNPGDEVIISSMEHNSVLRPLDTLMKDGVQVKTVWGSGEGMLDPDDLKKEISPHTRLIAVNHVSNVVGVVQPLEEIAELAQKSDVLLLVDAAQSLGHLPINIQNTGIDILVGSGHKGLLGPPGTGIMYVSPRVDMKPLIEGGTGSRSESSQQPILYPDFLESGTLNLPGIAGLGAGVAYIEEQTLPRIMQKNRSQRKHLLEGLQKIKKMNLFGPQDLDNSLAVISFNLQGTDPADLTTILDATYGIMVRAGLHCAPTAHRTLGTFPQGAVRVSPGLFNTTNDLDYFLHSVGEISAEH